MKGRGVCVSLLVVLVVALLLCVSDFRVAEAQSIITINSDGTFSPSGAAFRKSTEAGRDIYSLTSDISGYTIAVMKYHVTIDGAGYKLSGNSGIEVGVVLSGMQGVIVRNLEIQGFQTGVTMQNCGSCRLISNAIINNEKGGIEVSGTSTWNDLFGNTIKGNGGFGISLNGAVEHTTIIKNIIEQNQFGIDINDFSKENLVGGNAFVDNARHYGDYNGQQNKWNSDYDVAKGNYWSDYAARGYPFEDSKKGPNQDQAGSDGVWDHPYFVYQEADIKDNYPLVSRTTMITIGMEFKKEVDNTFSVGLTGQIMPKVSGATVNLTVGGHGPHGDPVTRRGETTTDSLGEYVWWVSGFGVGGVSADASWGGNDLYNGAQSRIATGMIEVNNTSEGEDWWQIIPGFPLESIILGMLLGFGALLLVRKKKLALPSGAP